MATPCVPGLLLDGEWIPPVRLYGRGVPNLAEILLAQGNLIFPRHHMFPFELALFRDRYTSGYVDLALVSEDYSAWFLIFVAPNKTTNLEYLRAQLEVARLNLFGYREAQYVSQQLGESDEARIEIMVADGPRFVVVTDEPRHGWDEEFRGFEVDIMVVEPFRVGEGFVFRVNGDHPIQTWPDVMGTCHRYSNLAGCLVVTWTDPDDSLPKGNLQLKYGEAMTNWVLTQGGSSWYLIPDAERFPLDEDPPFEIVRILDGAYAIRKQIEEA